jgi:hypothetical protein
MAMTYHNFWKKETKILLRRAQRRGALKGLANFAFRRTTFSDNPSLA